MTHIFVLPDHIFLQGNKKQLEEVWEENDGMDAEDFDPRTFFYMHGMWLAFDVLLTASKDLLLILCWEILVANNYSMLIIFQGYYRFLLYSSDEMSNCNIDYHCMCVFQGRLNLFWWYVLIVDLTKLKLFLTSLR